MWLPHTEEITETLIAELQSDIETDPSLLVEYERALEKTVDAMSNLPQDTQNILNMVVDSEFSYQQTVLVYWCC